MLIRLKDELNAYHSRRAAEHGRLYVVLRETDPDYKLLNLYEAKSITTGTVCTLDPEYTESYDG